MGLGRGGADDHAGRELVVAQPAGDQGHHLALPVGELLEGVDDLAVGWPGHVLADQPAGDRRRQQSVPPGGDPHRVQQVGRLDVLDQEPAGPGTQRVEDMLVEAVVGEDDHVHSRQARLGRDAPRGLDAVQDRHLDVHECDVG